MLLRVTLNRVYHQNPCLHANQSSRGFSAGALTPSSPPFPLSHEGVAGVASREVVAVGRALTLGLEELVKDPVLEEIVSSIDSALDLSAHVDDSSVSTPGSWIHVKSCRLVPCNLVIPVVIPST